MITSAIVETAVTSDNQAVGKVINDLEIREAKPDELLADAGYRGDENVELAKKKDVELVAPVPGSKKYDPEELSYEAFELTEQNELVACPAGHAPESTRFNPNRGYVWAQMDADRCATCPLLSRCRVQRASQSDQPTGRIQFDLCTVRSDRRRRLEQGEEYRERYRMRSGIEGTNGCLKRMMGLGRLRVRGMQAVSSAILLKLSGWNLLRAVALRNHRLKTNQPALT